jgi:hypothetical protein
MLSEWSGRYRMAIDLPLTSTDINVPDVRDPSGRKGQVSIVGF